MGTAGLTLISQHHVTDHAESMMLTLWVSGRDTNEIAKALGLPEFEIANRLPRLREARRLQQEQSMSSGQKWTAEMDAELKAHYDRGLSCSQIAFEMRRGLTRNAITGRIYRTGINGNPPRREPTTRAEREQKKLERERRKVDARRTARQKFRLNNPRPPIEEVKLRCVEIVPRNLSLLELEPNDCRYPYGDSPFTFCGHPKLHGSYCAAHFFLTVGPGTPSERAADRVAPRHLEAAE